jgi:hypothetical protein
MVLYYTLETLICKGNDMQYTEIWGEQPKNVSKYLALVCWPIFLPSGNIIIVTNMHD